jgi:hypothetical protein
VTGRRDRSPDAGETGHESFRPSRGRDALIGLTVWVGDRPKWLPDDVLELTTTDVQGDRELLVRERRELVVATRMEADLRSRVDEPAEQSGSQTTAGRIGTDELPQLHVKLVTRARRQVLDPAPKLVYGALPERRLQAERAEV